MSKAKSKNTTAKTADADLFKLHDKFRAAYGKMKEYDKVKDERGTKEQRALHRKWERAASVAFDKARAVIDAPAFTLEGMLMKLHISGFAITDAKPGTFTGPYQSGTRLRLWEPGKFAESDEVAIIISLRDDLHRFAGRLA